MRTKLAAVLVLTLAACGGNNDNNGKDPGTDMNVSDLGTSDLGQADMGGGEEDTGGSVDMATGDDTGTPDMAADDMGSTDMGTDMSEGPCDRNGMMFVSEDAYWDGFQFLYSGFTGDPMAMGADMGAGANYDFLSFEVYPDFGGMVGAQNYTFPGENYSECGTCLLIFADCTPGDACDKVFLVDSGSVEVTEMGSAQDDPFKATFSQLMFSEVTVDVDTYESTKVVGGETYCVDMVSADSMTTDDSM